MKYISLLLFIVTTLAFPQVAPEIVSKIPVNMKKAYDNGFRTFTGKPGTNYVQNNASYKIEAELFPNTKIIKGSAKIEYKNNFHENLDYIVIRLYQNAFKKGAERDFNIDSRDIHDGVRIQNLKLNGEDIKVKSDNVVDRSQIMLIRIPAELKSNKSFYLEMDWEVKIPEYSRIRMGSYSDKSFFVAYWYPQIAVYDDIDGWDENPHTFQSEFYNDFSDYDVKITAPGDFLLWATGELQNPDEIYTESILSKYNEAKVSDNIISIIDSTSAGKTKVTKNEKNSWNFKANYVPDFAFAAASDYLWDATSINVDDSKKRVFIHAAYLKSSKDFYDVAAISRKAIHYFSTDLPGVPYPYPVMSVFNGGGGMEFPMMVNDGSVSDYAAAVGLTSHEIAHTYFPFYMGINEVKYAFMDEGFAVMLPFKFQIEEGKYNPVANNARIFSAASGKETEVPPIIPSYILKRPAYRIAAYNRPGLAYHFLQDYLGESKFRTVLQSFMKDWAGKHPTPFDLFFSFNTYSNENLSWYFIPWFFESKSADLKISSVDKNSDNLIIEIENKGGLPLPVSIRILDKSGEEIKSIYKNAGVWKGETNIINLSIPFDDSISRIEMLNLDIPDVNKDDNIYQLNQDK